MSVEVRNEDQVVPAMLGGICNVEFLSSKKVAQGFVAIPKLLGLLFQVRT